MEEIKYLIEIFKSYGFGGVVGVSVAIFIIKLVKVEWFSKIYNKIKNSINKKDDDGEITESSITNHDIFSYIDLWTYSKVPTMQFSTEYRTIVFRKYLTIFLKSFKSNVKDYINSGEFKKMDEAQLWHSFLRLINDIVFSYEKEMEENGIPKIVIEKMKSKNNNIINLIIDIIGGICNSSFYNSENNLLKVYSIMNIMLSILENAIAHSELTCNSINGQLKGLSVNDGGRIITE